MIVRGDAVTRMEDDAHMQRLHVPEGRVQSRLPYWATLLEAIQSIRCARPSRACGVSSPQPARDGPAVPCGSDHDRHRRPGGQ